MLIVEIPKTATKCMRIDPGTVSVASQTDLVGAKNRPDQWPVIFRHFQFGLRLSRCTQMDVLDVLKQDVS